MQDDADAGFTLVELLVVVMIIGILAAIGIPTLLSQRQAGWRATLQSDLRNVAVEAEGYFHLHDSYDGFELSSAFAEFGRSDGVDMPAALVTSTATAYCIQAGLQSEVWSVRTDPTTGQPAIGPGTC